MQKLLGMSGCYTRSANFAFPQLADARPLGLSSQDTTGWCWTLGLANVDVTKDKSVTQPVLKAVGQKKNVRSSMTVFYACPT